ncbi:hypothetical protein FRACYDRAFT_270228 [Fragilariopsis cylindrus CCMP1102]|uniref:ShKT domain-containing protein n=1 Tax=Fragilariopsis cylindrus CCMP1102 TaxID=635003 RepID=A0A1E7F5P2_9STRA|nr:hypothetical protein FRACYDRAFT_270228 [Fragilariopsis cylindrus CCMP1102]|eukprot:OEU13183.1 hypothetical protein FRACYDRAFT_270228 [Fragilariopsis cylindrus CCMP1102]
MLSKQLLLILAVIFTITNNADAAKKCKDKKKNKFSIEDKGRGKKTCSEWIDEKGLLCKNSKKVEKNCKLSCGKCTASPTESPTDASCEDKEGKFKVRGKTTCAKLVELCPGSCGKCPPTAAPTASPTDSPTASEPPGSESPGSESPGSESPGSESPGSESPGTGIPSI